MTDEEKSLLRQLDRILRLRNVRDQIGPIISRVQAELAQKTSALMTWEPIPLKIFPHLLPADICSSWVFVLRAGVDTGAERHPNSHQRMMSMRGSGDMRTECDGEWRSNFLVSDPIAPLDLHSPKRLASAGDRERIRFGCGVVSHRAGGRIDRRTLRSEKRNAANAISGFVIAYSIGSGRSDFGAGNS